MELVLNYLNPIHPLSDSLVDHLRSILKTRELHKKDFLLRAGHTCRVICFIENGLLRCFYLKDDHEVCSWFMKEGDVIISVESFYQQKASYESIQALEDCVLYYIDYSELQDNPLGAHQKTLIAQQAHYREHAFSEVLQKMTVHELHHFEVLRLFFAGFVIDFAAVNRQQFALPAYR